MTISWRNTGVPRDAARDVDVPERLGHARRVVRNYYMPKRHGRKGRTQRLYERSQQRTSTVGRLEEPAVVVALVGLAPFGRVAGLVAAAAG